MEDTGVPNENGFEPASTVDKAEDAGVAGEVVRVDPPVDAVDPLPAWEARPVSGWRPVLPGWVKSRRAVFAAVWWLVRFVVHVVAFHLVRVPLYLGQLAAYSPRGLGRGFLASARWVLDWEGHPLRSSSVQRDEPEVYLKLIRERRLRVRLRAGLLAAATGVVIIGSLLLWWLAPWWVSWLTLAAAVITLGWVGRPIGKPLLSPAVVAYQAQRLTSDVIIRALGALGLAEINKAVKAGGGITFPAPITRDGPGWRADVDLPYGVTVTDIIERRDRLASGLRRPLGCVWPEPANDQHAGRLVLWVGDEDMNQTKPKAWPLAREGRQDLFKPIPFGTDPRGRPVGVDLMYSNVLIGAMPGAGKTFALRVLLLACALDPIAQLRVFELKGSGDLSTMERVAHHYGSGPGDDTIEQAMQSLREVYKDLDRRAKTIAGLPRDVCPENKVTPELAARKSLRLFPLVVAIDECQELFSHPEFGKEAGDLCTAIIKRGRALSVILLLATQRPDKASLPTSISANVGIRFCLRVMGQLENDMILGTSSYQNGLRATTFTQRDKGIGYLVGASDDPQILRTAYIDAPEAEKITQRAHTLRAAAGTLTGHAIGADDTTSQAPTVSLLADLVAVTRPEEPKVWLETLAARLAELRPDTYGAWAEADGETRARQLSAALKPYGITTTQVWATTGNGRGANRRGVLRADLFTIHERPQTRQRQSTARPPTRPSDEPGPSRPPR